MNTDQSIKGGGLLDQIVTASLLEVPVEYTTNQRHHQLNRILRSSDSDEEGSDEEEAFEDGDEGVEGDAVSAGTNATTEESPRESVAAVLTELSQATTNTTTTSNTLSAYTTRSTVSNPAMTATINSINALLQSHLNPQSSLPQKVRLSGPIRANINIRHGVWAPRLRCRKRKNLHAKDGIWIHPTCTLDQLIVLVRGVLPDEFDWDAKDSPLRYQAVNDQSLQSLKTVSATVAGGQGLYSAFDLVRNRRSDGDNFILQLYVYGTWTVLLKPHTVSLGNTAHDEDLSSVQPPPKKKYQQAHYSQQQQQMLDESSQGMFSHMRLVNNNTANNTASPSPSNYYTHPLAANPPVTFLPTVTLEMKLNGTFVPVEVSRRSFVAAIRACSIPKTTAPTTTNTKDDQANSPPSYNVTPPPSEA